MTEYFAILSFHTGKALTLPWNFTEENVLKLSEFEEEDNQFWFWDGRAIRSKHFPSKALDFHYYSWKRTGRGKVYLYDYHGKPNQRWNLVNGEFILGYQNLRLQDLDGFVTCDASDIRKNQKWTIEVTSKRYLVLNVCAL